jgi:hypothetical protein
MKYLGSFIPTLYFTPCLRFVQSRVIKTYDNYSALNYWWNHNGKISINPEHMHHGD